MLRLNMEKVLVICAAMFFGIFAEAQNKGFTFQAVIKDPSSTLINASNVTVNAKILAPNGCILREENFPSINIVNGFLSVAIAKGTATGADPAFTISKVFDNTNAMTGLTCINLDGSVNGGLNSYTPAASDVRKLRISFVNGADTIRADFNMRSAPMAVNAENLNGLDDTKFAKLGAFLQSQFTSLLTQFTGGNITTNVTGNVTGNVSGTAANVTGTVAIANGGTGATTAAAARTALGLGTLATTSPTGTANATTYLRGDGTWASVSGSGTVTSVTSANSDVAVATGTTTPVLTLNSGTTGGAGDANKIAKLDASGLLTSAMIPNLDATKITTGTIGRDVSATNVSATNGTFTNAKIYDGASKYLTMTLASGAASNLNLVWPNSAGSTGQVLTTNGAGTLSWAAASASGNSAASTSTLVARDSSGISNFYGVGIAGATSGVITMQAPSVVTSHTLVMPAAQGSTNTYLKNDGSGNLSWSTVSGATQWTTTGSDLYYNTGNIYVGNSGTTNATIAGYSAAYDTVLLRAISDVGNLDIRAKVPGGSVNPMTMTNDKSITFTNGTMDTGGLVIGPWSGSSKGLRIDAPTGNIVMGVTGNIGIGATSPSYKLDVAGDVNITGNFKINGTNISTGGGTVTGVTSANTDIGVATGTTTPVLTLNSGTAGGAGDANKIAKLDSGGLLVAAMIPSLDAAKIGTGSLAVARGGTGLSSGTAGGVPYFSASTTIASTSAPTSSGQVLRWNGSAWAPNFISMFDLRSTVTGAVTFGSGSTGCTSSQTLTWTSATDNLSCTNISLPVGQITGTLPIANGGTNNASLAVTAGGVIYSDGTKLMNVGVGSSGQVLTSNAAAAPTWSAPGSVFSTLVDATAAIKVGTTATACSSTIDGTIRYVSSSNNYEICKGSASTWLVLEPEYAWANVTANTTAVKGGRYIANTSGGSFTITLPASPNLGDKIELVDGNGSFGTNNLVVDAGSGGAIAGQGQTLNLDVNHVSVGLVYSGASLGWRLY